MRKLVLTAAMLSLTAFVARAAQQQASYPASIKQEIDQTAAACRADQGKFLVNKGAVESYGDINGDGQADYGLHMDALYCDAHGYSEWCGTAGCVLEIFVSSPRGYLNAYSDNVREMKVIRTGGKATLRFAMHGSACGKVGAAVCYESLVWKGAGLGPVGKPGFTPAIAPGGNAAPPPPAAVTPPPPPVPTWSVVDLGRGQSAAMLMRSGGFAHVALSCVEGKPTLFGQFAGYAPRAGRAALRLTVDKPIDIQLQYDPGSKEWMATLPDNRVYDLMTGPDMEADVLIDGRAAGKLSLAGSMAAARTALASCSGSAPPARAEASVAIGPLGIRMGYYVSASDRCEAASSVLLYDGKRIGFLYGRSDMPGPVGSVQKQRGGSFLLPASGLEIKPLGGDRIQVTAEDDVTMRLCPVSALPAEFHR